MNGEEGSINEPGKSRQNFSPPSINEPPQKPDLPDAEKPVISAIEPASAACGDPDFTLDVTGTGFTEQSVIHFAGHDEPTTFNSPDTLSTGVKPSLWTEPVTVQCIVKNGPLQSDPVDFTFGPPPGEMTLMASDDPDEIEEEIEEEIDEGDIEKPKLHRGKPSKTLPSKRKK